MQLNSLKIPPVSKEFYQQLVLAFPPLTHNYIKDDTSEIKIHRKAAEQRVIEYISRAVKESNNYIYKPLSLKDRIKFILFSKIGE